MPPTSNPDVISACIDSDIYLTSNELKFEDITEANSKAVHSEQLKQKMVMKPHAGDNDIVHSFKFSEIKWRNAILLIVFHFLAIYGQYRYITGAMKWQSVFVCYVFGFLSAFGITAGAHRLWSHRSYKAKWPLR